MNNEKPIRRVAIQGVEGCWHHCAAAAAFPENTVVAVECETFNDLFDSLHRDPDLTAVVAVENTIAGSLMGNHELLRKNPFVVTGEIRMRISHSLATLPGQSIKDITQVWSHPMALMQCEEFLRQHPWMHKMEHPDTAGAAKDIARDAINGRAAICSRLAAEHYGLEVIEDGIETNKRNFTRFLVLAHPDKAEEIAVAPENTDKASIVFTLSHEKGALSKILTILWFYDMNLTKIQSSPIIGREWEYRFYIDLTYLSYGRFVQAMDAVRPLLGDYRILGLYNEKSESK